SCMANTLPRTTELQAWLQRMRQGDSSALNELIQHTCGRLEKLTRKMLQGYPGVQRWAQTDDVLQSALVRLCRALEQVQPASMREFFALAATQVRRELIDLARHYYGPEGQGAHHASRGGGPLSESLPYEKSDLTHEPSALADWCEFHQQI